MRTSCITFSQNSKVLILREDYLNICEGNDCAAVVLAQMQYWHEVKNDHAAQAEAHNAMLVRAGEAPTQETETWIYKTQAEMKTELFGKWGDGAIREAFNYLLEKGYLQVRSNSKFAWDKTKQYQFQVEAVQASINAQNRNIELSETETSKPQNQNIEASILSNRVLENEAAIPEITTEITKAEITTKNNARPADAACVSAWFKSNGSTGAEARNFWNYYESNGWKVGRVAMKNWQAAARNWIARNARPTIMPNGGSVSLQQMADANNRIVDDMRRQGLIP